MLAGRRQAGTGAKGLQLRLTLDTSRRSRTLILPPFAVVALLGLLPVVGLIFLGATCYFIFHDDLLAKLTQHQIAMQYGYEDRVAELRHEITNLTQHAKINEAELTTRLGALTVRQNELENRTVLIASLAERAKALHAPGAGAAHPVARSASNPLLSAAVGSDTTGPQPQADVSVSYSPLDGETAAPKPQPQSFELRLDGKGAAPTAPDGGEPSAQKAISPLSFDFDLPLTSRLDELAARQDRVDRAQLAFLTELQHPVAKLATHLRAAFNAAGLNTGRFASSATQQNDVGGPFVPLPQTAADSAAFDRAAIEAQNAISAAEKLSLIATHVPFGSPLPGPIEVTSPFGARMDPFYGKPALHTGIDLRQDYGAPVHATADGTVSFAGSDGGYGNMVEIDHGNGLSTRYAHLSSITVRQGEKVEIGAVVGHIGETGRATGPHLHYETRINGEPVDPARFLRAGARLRMTLADNDL
jgi:murein DD-endopeptidase MepM/ murein hydrolase activator NlpD